MNAPPLTHQQRDAVTARQVSVVLSSGAGCGKTHVLTERYLSHLRDDGAEVGQVVAITFTDRAARQMRRRIRAAVVQHVRNAADDAEAERWARHLRALEAAPISTIHAFCAALLRQHAIEAGLDPQFDVLEDVLSVNFEAQALAACLQRLLTASTEAGEDLRQLVLLYGWRPVVEAVQHLVEQRDEPAWRQWLARPAEEVAAGWQELAGAVLLPRFVDYLTGACPKIARCLSLLRRHPPLPGPMTAQVQTLLEETPRLAEAADLAAAVERLREAAKVGRHGKKAWPTPEVYEEIRGAFEGFREELDKLPLGQFRTAPEDVAEAVAVGRRFLRVAGEAVQAYRELKRQHGVVDFQDLLVLARDLLRDHEDVRARLQERYQFVLIDELQDTDPVQMELVEHLCGGGLTEGKLFAVGDHKQSIYRFRGADVHLFLRLRQRVPSEGRLGLTKNFRSQPAILHFANALLGPRLTDYEDLVPHHRQLNPGPCVEFLWAPRGDGESVAESRAREADWIARRIAAMIGREKLVAERDEDGERLRPVRAGDVVLLFRAMSNVHLYEAALRRHGLDYYLVGGRAFFAQQEIYDLLNLLRALENPQDAVSLAGTLRSPFCCLSDEALFVLGRHPEGLWAGLHDDVLFHRLPEGQRAPAERARRNLGRWRGLKDRLPIARLLGEVLADSGYDAALQFEHLGDRKLANLWKLIDLARTFDRSGLFGLADFIARLGDLVRTQPREEQAATQPENADVVRLMTIHQAKGLEFPVVFVPDVAAAGRGPQPPAAHWDPVLGCVARPPAEEDGPPFPEYGWRLWEAREKVEDWHEDLRTLYVACTRAQDYLVLSAALARPFRPDNAWMLALADRFDLEAGACRAEDVPQERVPQVRVFDGFSGASQKRPSPQRFCEAPLKAGSAAATNPVPVRLAGKRLFTLAELHHLADDAPLSAEALAPQFDTEDGSDRCGWIRPHDRITPCQDRRERLLRDVLGRWDFRDAHGWQRALKEALTAEWTAGDAKELQVELAAALERFAASPTRQDLAAAVECRRDVEFSLPWPGTEGLWVAGVIDFLFRDEAHGWHALCFVPETAPPAGGRAVPVVLAEAARRLLGVEPAGVRLCSLLSGEGQRFDGRRRRGRRAVAALLSEVCRRTPT